MRYFLSFLLLVLCAACAAPARPDGRLLVLEHATVIDGRGGVPLPDRTIVLRGDRIESVEPTGRRFPSDAQRIDLRGRWVIPGLIDSHVHLHTRARDPGVIEQILSSVRQRSGATTVRDMGGRGPEVASLASAGREPGATSPDILYSALFTGSRSNFWLSGDPGTYVSAGTAPGSSPWFRHFDEGADFGPAVQAAKNFGARGIKAHSGFTATELRALGDATRREGLALWTHAYVGPARPSDAVDAGATTLSHADMLAYEGFDTKGPEIDGLDYVSRTRLAMRATPVDGERLTRLFEMMRDRGVCLEPTLQVFTPREPNPPMEEYARYAAQATGRAHRIGVAICAGTDGIGGSTSNLPIELALLVERAGLTPLEAISAATHNNAQALGLTDRGVIAPDFRADLVVLCADPATDIAAIKSVAAVVARGSYQSIDRCATPE